MCFAILLAVIAIAAITIGVQGLFGRGVRLSTKHREPLQGPAAKIIGAASLVFGLALAVVIVTITVRAFR